MNRTRTTIDPSEREWFEARQMVLEAERKERGNPEWVPTYLNGGPNLLSVSGP